MKHKVKRIEVDHPEPVTQYGYDIADEMTKILSEELAKQIDKEILTCLVIEDRRYRRKKSIKKIFNVNRK